MKKYLELGTKVCIIHYGKIIIQKNDNYFEENEIKKIQIIEADKKFISEKQYDVWIYNDNIFMF